VAARLGALPFICRGQNACAVNATNTGEPFNAGAWWDG
jgi:hypothetical protein